MKFRKVLPAYLAGEAAECFIEVDARAGGLSNPAWFADFARIRDIEVMLTAEREKITDPALRQAAYLENLERVRAAQIALLWEKCVIAWRTNILSDGELLTCNMANFLELAAVPVFEVRAAFTELSNAVLSAGDAEAEKTKADIKN